MHVSYFKRGGWLRAICGVLIVLLLGACAPNANSTPTVSVQAVYTAAFQTLAAQQATQQALIPPTNTPLPPTPLPSLPPPSALPTFAFASPTVKPITGGGGGACDSSAFVADVTIPDNTVIDPGKTFTKTWTLLNNGSCTWGSGYSLAFKSGDQMNGATVALANSVAPGSSINISVKLTAPTASGTYKGFWQMQNASNQSFGDAPFVLIKVTGGPTATAGPSPTPGLCPGSKCTITITSTGRPDFTVTITKNKAGNTECIVPAGTDSCSFTVPLHWDGTVTLSKGKWTFDGSPYTFTNVVASTTVNFPAH